MQKKLIFAPALLLIFFNNNRVFIMFHAGEKYEAVIGLEVHIQLSKESKASSSDAESSINSPNSEVSIRSLQLHRTFPKLNSNVFEYAIKPGLDVNSEMPAESRVLRKRFGYHDLPEGYPIWREKFPICKGGYVGIRNEVTLLKKNSLNKIPIKEDAGKSIHDQDPASTFIDHSSAGVPLEAKNTVADSLSVSNENNCLKENNSDE